MERIACSWCHYESESGSTSCGTCGAPLDAANMVSESGWRAAPRLREMAEFKVGNVTCQVAGQVVPVAEFTLAEGDTIFFEQHTLLWKERTVALTGKNLKQAGQRLIAPGMPHAIVEARGPGRIAVTRDASGEVVVLPLHPGVETDLRGHAFLAASQNVGYSFVKIDKLTSMFHGGPGMYLDRFVASDTQGLLLLHGYGNVFQRRLGPGEKILVEPGGFLYKDAPVAVNRVPVQKGTGYHHSSWAELTGPGRVGIQSMYVHRHHN